MTLPDRITLARERKGWTAHKLGVKAGLSPGMIYRLESGERAKRGSSGETIAKLAKALGVRAEWLLTGIEPMEESEVDPLPARRHAVLIAREGGVHEEAIASVLAEPKTPEDATRPILWWIDQMRRRELDLLTGRRRSHPRESADEPAPPKPPDELPPPSQSGEVKRAASS